MTPTWRQYFKTVADTTRATDWKFSQEDVLVSLVWGAQVLQRGELGAARGADGEMGGDGGGLGGRERGVVVVVETR